jgi:hypothetical protein
VNVACEPVFEPLPVFQPLFVSFGLCPSVPQSLVRLVFSLSVSRYSGFLGTTVSARAKCGLKQMKDVMARATTQAE